MSNYLLKCDFNDKSERQDFLLSHCHLLIKPNKRKLTDLHHLKHVPDGDRASNRLELDMTQRHRHPRPTKGSCRHNFFALQCDQTQLCQERLHFSLSMADKKQMLNVS